MILEPDQRLAAEFGFDVDGQARGSTKRRHWPNGVVPYTVNSSLSSQPKAMQAIRGAMDLWSSRTCIRFIPRTTEKAYIEFFKGKGCWSYVGRIGKKQLISLGKRCWRKGTVSHEIGKAGNFKKYSASSINSLGTPYDYGSIMHYSGKSFTKNGKPTIVPKKIGTVLGQRQGPSAIDVLQMNRLYKCSGPSSFGSPKHDALLQKEKMSIHLI
ncbi:hypothetical protein OS493_008448 [Desmophyllum pertusum]|uniref:Metalloendopeptidase n=1 Tax=Desmophyllum pertusum TaxID=174260 RepID=A0A9X0A4V8_9CNID|nr:hypothetical protein OS493_008448 [Desmophyllum pertusum]